MSTPAEIHNQMAEKFVRDVVAKTTTKQSELMVVIESCILATLITATKLYGLPPAHATEQVELAIQRAVERFTETQK